MGDVLNCPGHRGLGGVGAPAAHLQGAGRACAGWVRAEEHAAAGGLGRDMITCSRDVV